MYNIIGTSMVYTDIRYGILLSSGQLDFLRDDQQGFHRAEALTTFVKMAAIEPVHYEKKNFEADLDVGQFVASTVELATLWGCDRKTAAKVVRMFNEMGILTSKANNRTTVHTIHCLAFWLGKDGDDEKTIRNPHYARRPVIKVTHTSGFPTSNKAAKSIGAMRHGQLTVNNSSSAYSDSDAYDNTMGNNRAALGNNHILSNAFSAYSDSPVNRQQATAGETSTSSEQGI
jgi:hypothetical protein